MAHKRANTGGVMHQVYTADAREVVSVPSAAISHLPRPGQHVKKLVLCHYYDPDRPDACPKGTRCKFVHVDLSKAQLEALTRSEVHLNSAYRSLADVPYPRFPPGTTIDVAAPDGDITVDRMDTNYALQTRALCTAQQRHCAHYYYNRACHLGPECNFVHAVYVDAKAGENQRAPAPREIGRSTPHAAAENVMALPMHVETSTYGAAPARVASAIPTSSRSASSAPEGDFSLSVQGDTLLPFMYTRYRRDPYAGGLVSVKYDARYHRAHGQIHSATSSSKRDG